jgi:hypothetical protein
MFQKLLNKLKRSNFVDVSKETEIYQHYMFDQKDMERLFVRLFSSDDGKKGLAYLQYLTFQRVLSADVSGEHLRYMEGQRALVASILRLIDRGRRG